MGWWGGGGHRQTPVGRVFVRSGRGRGEACRDEGLDMKVRGWPCATAAAARHVKTAPAGQTRRGRRPGSPPSRTFTLLCCWGRHDHTQCVTPPLLRAHPTRCRRRLHRGRWRGRWSAGPAPRPHLQSGPSGTPHPVHRTRTGCAVLERESARRATFGGHTYAWACALRAREVGAGRVPRDAGLHVRCAACTLQRSTAQRVPCGGLRHTHLREIKARPHLPDPTEKSLPLVRCPSEST